MNKKIAVTLLSLVMLFSFVVIVIEMPTHVKAETIWVDNSGGADYTNIQDAINIANPGDTVYVHKGLYKETIIVNKSIDLIGENRDNTIIEGYAWGKSMVKITVDFVNITGFKIILKESGSNWDIAGIDLINVQGCNVIRNNIFLETLEYGIQLHLSNNNNIIGNEIHGGFDGIKLHESKCNNITENKFLNNHINAIELTNSDYNHIVNNNFSYCDTLSLTNSNHNNITDNIFLDMCDCIFLKESSNNIITNNNISSNIFYGIHIYYSSKNNITNNDIKDGSYGIDLYHSSDNRIIGNNISHNSFGIYISYSSDNLITSNNIFNNKYGIEIFDSSDNRIYDNNLWKNQVDINDPEKAQEFTCLISILVTAGILLVLIWSYNTYWKKLYFDISNRVYFLIILFIIEVILIISMILLHLYREFFLPELIDITISSINIWLYRFNWLIHLLSCAFVYFDSTKINAGKFSSYNTKYSRTVSWSPFFWAVLVLFIPIIPFGFYIYKRKEIYKANNP